MSIEPNFCDQCLIPVQGRRLALGDVNGEAVWTIAFVDVDQSTRLVACEAECARIMAGDLTIPGVGKG